MNLAQRLTAAFLALAGRVAPTDGHTFGSRTESGVHVDARSALTLGAVWGCVRLISETLGALPMGVYEKRGRDRVYLANNDINWLLSIQPNPEMTAMSFRELLTASALLRGNGYAEIQRTQDGRPYWLWPIAADRVTPTRDADTGDLLYRIRNGMGQPDTVVLAADMLHIHGMGHDGLVGYSVVEMAARSIGMGIALDQYGSSFFRNGAHIGGVLEHPGQLTEAAREALQNSLADKFSGALKAGKTIVLEEGMKYAKTTIPPNEAQFLESRAFSVEEICRWYGVPPHKLAVGDRATFASVEQLNIDFVQQTILPWAVRWEQEVNIKLFGRINRGRLYSKLNLAALLRGDGKSRAEAYAIGRQWGWWSANDIRELEDLNPIDGGDEYLVPMNMTAADLLREEVEARIERAQRPDPAPAPAPASTDGAPATTAPNVDTPDDTTAPSNATRDPRIVSLAETVARLARGT
jgi:HK97 family phage portal protein